MKGFGSLLRVSRAQLASKGQACRIVYMSDVLRNFNGVSLSRYVADRAPLFYRDPAKVAADISDGYFVSAVKATLAKMPTAKSFQESHFAEIASGIFAEEVLGLVRLYSKLTLLTAENANAFKMDLLLCDPKKEPVEFVFGEVKSSIKSTVPANHHKGIYADLFSSMKKYEDGDRDFDLTAAKDRLAELPLQLTARIREALKPYSGTTVRYAGFVVIDTASYQEGETEVLHTRKSAKELDVDLICVESLAKSGREAYDILERLRNACSE